MGIFFTLVTMSVCVYCVLTFNFYDVEKEKINKEKSEYMSKQQDLKSKNFSKSCLSAYL